MGGVVLALVGVLLCAWSIEGLGTSMNEELMFAYKGDSSDAALRRLALMGCAFVTIAGLWFAVPKRLVPLVTQWGKNSLTIYI